MATDTNREVCWRDYLFRSTHMNSATLNHHQRTVLTLRKPKQDWRAHKYLNSIPKSIHWEQSEREYSREANKSRGKSSCYAPLISFFSHHKFIRRVAREGKQELFSCQPHQESSAQLKGNRMCFVNNAIVTLSSSPQVVAHWPERSSSWLLLWLVTLL